jgi:hypothetical protein
MFFIIVSKNLQALEVFLWTKMSLRCVKIGGAVPVSKYCLAAVPE